MNLSSFGRARVVVAAAASCGAAAAILAAGAGSATAAPAARPVVVVTCTGRTAVRPSTYVLTCADGNNYLSRLRWVHWAGEAFGMGLQRINACHPTCVSGKFYSFPVLVTLWRPRRLPGRHGLLYFSRLTLIHTGSLRLPHNPDLPQTETDVLSPTGGI
jgi:hypothetical protein